MQCKGEVGGFKLYSIVVQLFEFINCQIPFLNYFTIREPLVLISFIKKNQNQKPPILVISKPLNKPLNYWFS